MVCKRRGGRKKRIPKSKGKWDIEDMESSGTESWGEDWGPQRRGDRCN
jgi:hypothetical protein